MRKLRSALFIFIFLFVVLADRQPAQADCRFFSDLLHNGGYAVADSHGKIISSCNETISYIPASIIKIPLALAAFEVLGQDFHFATELYTDEQENLYIKGTGDPFLVSEEVELIVDQLISRGVKRINGIFIDNSNYALTDGVPGKSSSDNPYDAPVSSVAVNFNTVNILVGKNGTIVSAEPQTPTLPIMQDLGKGLQPGEYRLNVCQGECSAEVLSARYAAELFRAVLQKKNMPGNGPQQKGVAPDEAKLVYSHTNTRNLEDIVLALLKYSNNFIANQLFLRCGVKQFGWPATWEKARRAMKESLAIQLDHETAGQLFLVEGAGLSRRNQVTAQAMIKVLKEFKPYAHLLQEKRNASLKSGTLQGVYNYAGYLPDGKLFAILLNQEKNTRDRIFLRLQKK